MDKKEMSDRLNAALADSARHVRVLLLDPSSALPHIEGQPPLTANEKHAVALAVKGHFVKDIARFMKTSTNTAGSYLKRVRAKTGLGKAALTPFILGLIRKELE